MNAPSSRSTRRILTFNWHEAYLAMLAGGGHHFDVVQRNKAGLWFWLYTTRPVPDNVSLVHVQDAQRRLRSGYYDLVICHTPRDVEEIEGFDVPAVLVFHNYLQTELALSKAQNQTHFSEQAGALTRLADRAATVFISEGKKKSWGLPGEVILPGIDPELFRDYRGDDLRVLRVGNFLIERDLMMGGALQQEVLKGVPTTTLGLNPTIPGAGLSASFEKLQSAYRDHRAYLHTTRPGAEDGYNLALLEAMATGMPAVGLRHPNTPIKNGDNGWIADDVMDLRHALFSLLEDHDAARRMGLRGRDCVIERFSLDRFHQAWEEVIEVHSRASDSGRAPQRPMDAARFVRPPRSSGILEKDATAKPKPRRRRLLLLYTAYPATTARYLERSLRRHHLVVTAGPSITPENCKQWNLQNLREPPQPHDISVSAETDLETIWSLLPPGFEPDCVLWVETGLGFFPRDLNRSPVPVLGYLVDTHFHLDWHVTWSESFDHCFVAQRAFVSEFQRRGVSASWLPLACDPEVHRPGNFAKEYDLGFVGSLVDPRRAKLLDELRERFRVYVDRLFLEEMSASFSRARIVWNCAARGDMNMRVFEALASGSFLLTEQAPGSGQDELFEDGRHLALYDESNLIERVEFYLKKRPEEREEIARRGRAEVLARHTYDHRVVQILSQLDSLVAQRHTDAPETAGHSSVDTTSPTRVAAPT